MSSHKKMKGLQHAKPRISYSSTTVKQQRNPHSLREGNRNELLAFFSWLVCAAGHYFQSLRDLLRCSSSGSDSHLSRGEGISPLSLAAHCWLLTRGDANLRLPDPSRDRCTSCTKLPVKAFLPGAGTELPKGRRIFLVPLGVNLSSLWQRTRTEKTEKLNQTKQIKLVTGD